MDVICLQLCPEYKNPQASMNKANKMLEEYSTCDILVLPEMAFPGYSFDNAEDIRPYLEKPNSDYNTFQFCAAQARRLGAYVFCGYPEEADDGLYNSMMVVDPNGSLIKNYRKSFLYHVDKTWCIEGSGFDTVVIQVKGRELKVGLGICMDINPYEFTAPFTDFEMASHYFKEEVDLIAFCTNWTRSEDHQATELDLNLLNYWLNRLVPFLKSSPKPVYFIAADRVGSEKGITYSGTSCILKLSSKPALLACLDPDSEKVLNYKLSI